MKKKIQDTLRTINESSVPENKNTFKLLKNQTNKKKNRVEEQIK